MQKIISLYQRNYDGDYLVRDEVVPGAEWVLAGEGVPTRKFDGTCVLIESGLMWKRYEVKDGKTPPHGFRPTTDVDPVTGKQQGWLLVADEDRWHKEAVLNHAGFQGSPIGDGWPLPDGTYELVGPKVNGNPDKHPLHALIRHGSHVLNQTSPPTFESIRSFLTAAAIEGIVWHHPDGRMVKIKAKDFGLKRFELLEDVPDGVTRVRSAHVIATLRGDGRWYNQTAHVVPLDAAGPWTPMPGAL